MFESNCLSCGARMIWVRGGKGHWMPVDAEPVSDGNLELIKNDRLVIAAPINPLFPPEKRYKSHFATCPDADGWRRR